MQNSERERWQIYYVFVTYMWPVRYDMRMSVCTTLQCQPRTSAAHRVGKFWAHKFVK